MLQIILGAVGMMLVLMAFVGGFLLGNKYSFGGKSVEAFARNTSDSEEEKSPEEIAMERKRIKDEQDAFNAMQNYNVEMAYGLKGKHEEGDLI